MKSMRLEQDVKVRSFWSKVVSGLQVNRSLDASGFNNLILNLNELVYVPFLAHHNADKHVEALQTDDIYKTS